MWIFQVEIHEDFLQDCINRLKAMYDTINALERNNDNMPRINLEAQRMIRILTVLRVYITDCDEAYADERAILPLYR
jgi:ubiquitin carboxyl-terminal hydrolase 9/24